MKKELIEYRHGNAVLEGYLVYDDQMKGKRPGVIVVHEWYGLNDYARERTEQLADLGYTAFAIDMYGKGVRAKNVEEAAKLAGIYRSDRRLMRTRAAAGLDTLRRQPFVDTGRIAAIGYCFGGGTALELARSGAELSGVVSFHGNLDTPNPDDAKAIRARVLALHGADDPLVTPEQVHAFQGEMRNAALDWQMVIYGGAVHSFCQSRIRKRPFKGNSLQRKGRQALLGRDEAVP
jgi:dienelactone hydrolase